MNIRTKPKFVNKHAKPSVSWVNKLEEYKNLAIIIGFLSYIIGFVLWSVYLCHIDAGYVYLYDFNLIISGLLPTLLLLSIFYIFKNYLKIFNKINNHYLKNTKWYKLFYSISIFLIFIWIIISYINIFRNWFDSNILLVPLAIIVIINLICYDLTKKQVNYKSYLNPVVVILMLSTVFFTSIPQEFGGAKPRWVALDIDTHEFSNETLEYLYLNRETNISSTRPLMILYSNSDFILIKKTSAAKAIMIKTRYVNSIKSVSNQELYSYNLRIEQENLKATCLLMHTPAGLSCDQFVYPPLKKPIT